MQNAEVTWSFGRAEQRYTKLVAHSATPADGESWSMNSSSENLLPWLCCVDVTLGVFVCVFLCACGSS